MRFRNNENNNNQEIDLRRSTEVTEPSVLNSQVLPDSRVCWKEFSY